MNNLENKLRELGVLEKFIRNIKDNNINGLYTMRTAFAWRDTTEGYDFWSNITLKCKNCTITAKRIKKLKQKFQLYPPRYKENL